MPRDNAHAGIQRPARASIKTDANSDMTATDADRKTDLQSFGRRKGRKLSPRQQAMVRDQLPKLRAIVPPDGAIDLAALFCSYGPTSGAPTEATLAASVMPAAAAAVTPTATSSPVWLEIGFGGGEHLIWQAGQNRDINFIGCEPFLDGLVKVLDAIDGQSLRNIRLLDDDVRPLLRCLPDASIARAFILFPDPWPKKKHHKRRLISKGTLDLLARVLKPGAQLRIGTDIADYAKIILAEIHKHPLFDWPATGVQDWRQRPSDWPPTRYEQKAQREGRPCSYFTFERTG